MDNFYRLKAFSSSEGKRGHMNHSNFKFSMKFGISKLVPKAVHLRISTGRADLIPRFLVVSIETRLSKSRLKCSVRLSNLLLSTLNELPAKYVHMFICSYHGDFRLQWPLETVQRPLFASSSSFLGTPTK